MRSTEKVELVKELLQNVQYGGLLTKKSNKFLIHKDSYQNFVIAFNELKDALQSLDVISTTPEPFTSAFVGPDNIKIFATALRQMFGAVERITKILEEYPQTREIPTLSSKTIRARPNDKNSNDLKNDIKKIRSYIYKLVGNTYTIDGSAIKLIENEQEDVLHDKLLIHIDSYQNFVRAFEELKKANTSLYGLYYGKPGASQEEIEEAVNSNNISTTPHLFTSPQNIEIFETARDRILDAVKIINEIIKVYPQTRKIPTITFKTTKNDKKLTNLENDMNKINSYIDKLVGDGNKTIRIMGIKKKT